MQSKTIERSSTGTRAGQRGVMRGSDMECSKQEAAYSVAGLLSLMSRVSNMKIASGEMLSSLKTMSPTLREKVLKAIEETQRSALPVNGRDPIVAALAYTEALTARPTEGGDDIKFKAKVYAQELRRYPGDLVIHVCQHWNRFSDSKWFPALREIEDVINKQNAWRSMVIKLLKEK